MWTRKDLKTNAKTALKSNYWKAVLAAVVMTMFTSASGSSNSSNVSEGLQEASSTLGTMDPSTALAAVGVVLTACLLGVLISVIFSVFVVNPFQVGAQKLFLNCKDNSAKCGDVLYAFKNSYMNIVKGMFMKNLFIALWSLLLVVPGIVKTYEYRMVSYLLAENPGMSWKEAIAKSKEMMNGQKWNAFVLDLSFIGWHLLSACTCGILGLFYVMPYALLTNTELYYALKTE